MNCSEFRIAVNERGQAAAHQSVQAASYAPPMPTDNFRRAVPAPASPRRPE
jgi:hypothetical protein